MKEKHKRIICLCLSAVFILSSVNIASADDKADAKSALSSIEEELKMYEQRQAELESQIDALAKNSENYDELRKTLQKKVSSMEEQMNFVDSEIAKLDSQIEQNELDIYNRNEQLYGAKEELKDRLRAIYVSGANSNLAILLGAESLGDYLARTELLRGVSDHDKQLMDSLLKEVGEINQIKNQNDNAKAKNAVLKSELQQKRAQYDTEYEQATAMLSQISGEQDELYHTHEELDEVIAMKEAEAEEWREVIESMSGDFEFGAAPTTTTATTTTTTTTTTTATANKTNGGGVTTTTKKPTTTTTATTKSTQSGVTITDNLIVSAQGFAWPFRTSYYISCPYGQRETRFHTGVDITCGNATGKPIYASASGYVIRAKHSNVSYGNHIIIDHGKKNGQSLSTLYAHCDSLLVEVGDYVQQGQLIAYCGSTGNSTGPHLHFEVRVDGYCVNPFDYIPYQ